MRALSLDDGSIADPPLTFAAIYDEAFPWVWRAARRLGVPDSALDDVTQDVFVVVHRKLATLEGRASLRPWVYGITLRVVRDRRRSARRHPEHATNDDEIDGLRCEGEDPQTNAIRREALGALLEVLDSMSDEQREVFVLAELEELSAPEIAEATATNVNTVYSRLRAARKAFEAGAARLRARERFMEANNEIQKGGTR